MANVPDPKSWIDNTFRRIMLGFSFGDPAQMALVTGKPVPPEKIAELRRDVAQHLNARI